MAGADRAITRCLPPDPHTDFRPVELNSLIEDVHTLITTHMRQKENRLRILSDPTSKGF